MKDKRRNLRSYREATARLKRQTQKNNWPCWLCREPFDWDLPYHDRMAFTADHVTSLAQGGHILGALKPAHRKCNSSRNDGRGEQRLPTTRRW